MKKVSFDSNTNFKNKIINRKVFTKNVSIKKRNYNMYKSYLTGLRIQQEILDEKKFNERYRKESLAEYLLYKNKLYYQISKIYRISNVSLDKLIKRLL